MQAQAQISGKVPGQVAGQMPGVLSQSTFFMPAQGWRRTWQTDADVGIRRILVEQILHLFQKRKPQVSLDWQQKLPDFVKRLEESLYRDAASKEEYADITTLEQRLQAVAKRIAHPRNSQSFGQHGVNTVPSSSIGSMIPTPGMPSGTNGGTMIPTPGSDINIVPAPGNGSMTPNTGNMSNLLPSSSGVGLLQGHTVSSIGNLGNMMPTPGLNSKFFSSPMDPILMPGSSLAAQQKMGPLSLGSNAQMVTNMGMSGVGSQMIPTPGLNSSQQMGMNANSSSGMRFSNIDSGGAVQQQFNCGSSGYVYRSLNGQLGGNMSNGMQRKTPGVGFPNGGINNGLQLIGNRQQPVNGNTGFPNSSGYMNSHFGNAQMQNQQLMTQQQQQHLSLQSRMSGQVAPFAGDGYAMNAADLAGPGGNFCNSVSSSGISTNNGSMNALGSQTSKMIPVPGLPSQQMSLQSKHHLQQPQLEVNEQHSQQSTLQSKHQIQQPQSTTADQSEQVGLQQNSSSQQQQLVKAKSLYQTQISSNPFGQKQAGYTMQQENSQPTLSTLPPLSLPHQSLPEQQLPNHVQYKQPSQLQLQQQHHQQIQSPPQAHQQLWQQETQKIPQIEQQQCQQRNANKCQEQLDACLQQDEEVKHQKLQQQQITHRIIQQQQSHLEPHQQVPYQEDAKQSQQASPNGSVSTGQTTNRTGIGATITSASSGNSEGQRAQQYQKQQWWLLFLRHASKCTALEGQCHQTAHCHTARQLWGHITKCTNRECQYPRCQASRTLLKHHQQCRDANCPVCGPVRQILIQQRAQATQGHTGQGQSATASSSSAVANIASTPAAALGGAVVQAEMKQSGAISNVVTQVQQPPMKRAKIEVVTEISTSQEMDMLQKYPSGVNKNQSIPQVSVSQGHQTFALSVKSESYSAVKEEGCDVGNATVKEEASPFPQPNISAQRLIQAKVEVNSETECDPGLKQPLPTAQTKNDTPALVTSKVLAQVKQEVVSNTPSTAPDTSNTAKSCKPKVKGVSLTELFTPEQIREHIAGLRQWVGQSKAKAERNQAMEHHMSENSCQLCAVEKLAFEPPPIYCTPCGARVKRNAPYWTVGSGETRHYFCIPCYNDIRTDMVELDGLTYPKIRLEKRKNDEETEEAWVQCDKCEVWQHQVCALFNGRRNEGGQAEYTCPYCYIKEIERGERKPLPQSAVLGGKDLPRTLLSDHIEQRLARRLRQELHERARAQGKSYDEVPAADSLIVRVVSSVDKKLEVKQRFLEIFQEDDYPTEFPYKSKVLLLFQKIEGVEVCLFGMYVQEFGSECAPPNQRRVYLSYLDSVKYFRPEVKAVTGEALRTVVYHEILIGYLDYCKMRGFTSCYIWACPPLKGEDYILYCHPEIQKTPKADKLREWYLAMLRKAMGENIVVEVTNLYDHFFVSTGECKAKVTAARLPYFDGDYWPGAAEDMIMQLQQQEEDVRKLQKKGKTKSTATKRASKAASQAELASNASKDLQLMHKLGESIYPMREDFIMVHMQFSCTHCCNFIVSGCHWDCKLCKNFHICDRCYEAEQKLDDWDRHPVNSKEVHQLFPVEVNDVCAETKDNDEMMESEFFDTRQAFLSLCQGNHYQYDTLRRAKHSSMMVLYHLHNPTAPAFVTPCNMCHHDIETGQGWRCEICPDFDICNACYQKDDSVKHPHKLSPHPSVAEREAQNKEARQQRVLQLRKMLDLLVHASQCCSPQCLYPNCRRVKGLFRHGMNCKTRASGGCPLCKKMWYLLQLHARACKESECRVPRCKDLKEHLRRLQQQMESRRRAAVMEMMRQRAAEAAGSSN